MQQPALRIPSLSSISLHYLFGFSSLGIILLTALAGYSRSYAPVVLAAGLLAVCWMLTSPTLALSVYLLSFSFAIPLIDAGAEFYLDDFLFPVVLLYFSLHILLNRERIEYGEFGHRLLLFWSLAVVLTALNIWRFDTRQLLKSTFQLTRLLEYILTYILASTLIRNARDTGHMLNVLLLGAGWVALAGLYQFAVLHEAVIVSTLSSNHAHIGAYINILFFIVLVIFVRSKSFPAKWGLAALLGILLFLLVQSYSRASWLGFVVSLFIFLGLRRAWGMAALITVLGLLVMLAGFTPEAISSRYELTFQSPGAYGTAAVDLSTLGRFYIWYGIFHMMASPFNFIFGVGQGAFQFAIRPFVPLFPDGASGAHNNFLHVFSELGIVGLSVFALLLWKFFAFGLRTYRQSPHRSLRRDYAIAFLSVILGLGTTMVSQETFSVQEAFASFFGFFLFTTVLFEKRMQPGAEETPL